MPSNVNGEVGDMSETTAKIILMDLLYGLYILTCLTWFVAGLPAIGPLYSAILSAIVFIVGTVIFAFGMRKLLRETKCKL